MIYFERPAILLFMFLIPLCWLFYNKYLFNRINYLSIDYSYASVINALDLQPKLWKRIFYPILLSIMSIMIIVAASEPTIEAKIATTNADIMLMIDTSISMAADDIAPSRLDVCRTELTTFIENLPKDTRLGLVFFAGDATLVSSMTKDKASIISRIQNISYEDLQGDTDIGKALYVAYNSLLKEEVVSESERAIIILSDGGSTTETYSPTRASSEALSNGIKVYTIGFGGNEDGYITWKNPSTGEDQEYEIFAMKSEELQSIAESGGGIFFRAVDQDQLHQIYNDINSKTTSYSVERYNISFIFCIMSLISLLFLVCGLFFLNWIFKNHI